MGYPTITLGHSMLQLLGWLNDCVVALCLQLDEEPGSSAFVIIELSTSRHLTNRGRIRNGSASHNTVRHAFNTSLLSSFRLLIKNGDNIDSPPVYDSYEVEYLPIEGLVSGERHFFIELTTDGSVASTGVALRYEGAYQLMRCCWNNKKRGGD